MEQNTRTDTFSAIGRHRSDTIFTLSERAH